MASTISDRATDEVLEALTRYKRGLGIPENDSPYDDTLVSDIVRSQSSHVSRFFSTFVSHSVTLL